ncbi:hypothetical protein QQS21_009519 [Conoideocrella luteorostrata]|uniref:Uncharacterized protein n=1 Tax=Conoideocrella luteorostrata TaxID=1105319 RepID=A0AAJ0CL66_9HYPO|nr:hypothetical protein QQS21_009519 [Conoideocrella luteorostrata]
MAVTRRILAGTDAFTAYGHNWIGFLIGAVVSISLGPQQVDEGRRTNDLGAPVHPFIPGCTRRGSWHSTVYRFLPHDSKLTVLVTTKVPDGP